MKITVQEIETCFALLMKKVKDHGVTSIETGQYDLYWSVPTDEWLDFQEEPNLVVESLDEDIRNLRRLIFKDSEVSLTDLDRMASILRLIASELEK